MIKKWISRWKQYKYRFVPWIALTLKHRSVRQVKNANLDKIITDEEALQSLKKLFQTFEDDTQSNKAALGKTNNNAVKCKDKESTPSAVDAWELHYKYQAAGKDQLSTLYQRNLTLMKEKFGFCVERKHSCIPGGGTGVFVTDGRVPSGHVVALYPGVVYQSSDPVFFQSIGNPFIFRCVDSVLIDGNDKALSKLLCRSCCHRDRVGPYYTADMTWLTQSPLSPLSVGQYVNNQSKEFSANVAYQELDISEDFPFHLKKYIPNINYRMNTHDYELHHNSYRRTVVLVSTRDIEKGEELYSTYFTVVH